MSTVPGNQEKKLLKRLRRGDSSAFEVLFNTYKNRLYAFAFKFVKSEDLACDILHEVFLKVWEKRKKINPDLNFNSYLHTICKHTVYNFLKKASRKEELKLEIINSTLEKRNFVEEDLYFQQYEKMASDAINQLPPRRKEVFQLCKMDGKSYDETASSLGISKNAVKDHMVKASKFIKRYFLKHGEVSL
ncbi:MAG: RNA polymerase sigma-70 factor [Cytophagales bacterium]|nr:RNA polymerase sigma-70 factor [Cytophagales bacterium]